MAKVLHVAHTQYWDGHHNRMLNECVGLKALGHDVYLSVPKGILSSMAEDVGVSVISDTVREFDPYDIVHTHCASSMLFASGRIDKSKSKLVCGIHFNLDYTIKPIVFPRDLDRIVCVSDYDARQYRSRYVSMMDKICSIPTSVDVVNMRRSMGNRQKTRESLGIGPDDIVVGMVARNIRRKGYDTMKEASGHLPHLTFLAVGEKTESLTAGNIIGTGYRKDIGNYLSCMDIYIQPSKAESLGTAIIEAASMEIPIVASQIGGIPDFIIDGLTGMLTPVDDAVKLARNIQYLISNAPFAKMIGSNAYQKALNEYNIDTMIKSTDSLYRNLLES